MKTTRSGGFSGCAYGKEVARLTRVNLFNLTKKRRHRSYNSGYPLLTYVEICGRMI
jgi:hypothetical protein